LALQLIEPFGVIKAFIFKEVIVSLKGHHRWSSMFRRALETLAPREGT
jgi:hypothetical protein